MCKQPTLPTPMDRLRSSPQEIASRLRKPLDVILVEVAAEKLGLRRVFASLQGGTECMGTPSDVASPQQIRKIGILLGNLGKFNASVLKFLVLQMNTLQQTFEYEFLPVDYKDAFLQKLSYQSSVDKEVLRQEVRAFRGRYRGYLEEEIEGYKVEDKQIPAYHILVTMACFQDGYYSMVEKGLVILALGDWKRYMAPPSIVEFILTLIVRHSVGSICVPLRGSVHLGTKGCLFDFTASLDEVRLKVLSGFICSSCRSTLISAGFNQVPEELSRVLKKDWLGKADEPEKPAGIAANLGYDLFATKGPQPTAWETLKKALQEEWVKSLLALVVAVLGAIVTALLLVRFGLQK